MLRDGRFGETEWVELVHNDESGSGDRRYPRGMKHGNEPPGSIAAQWIRAIFSVSMRSVRAAHTVLCYTKCFGTLDVKLVILAFPVARMRSVILPFVPCFIRIFKPIWIMGRFRKPTAACLNACRRSSWKINPFGAPLPTMRSSNKSSAQNRLKQR